jgi:hypothetical protein
MATATATGYGNPPRYVETGSVAVPFDISATGLTAGSVVFVAKVPDRAVIIDAKVGRTGSSGDITLKLSASFGSAVLATASASGLTQIVPNMINYQVSVSDDASVKYVNLKATITSAVATEVAKGVVVYTMGDRK